MFLESQMKDRAAKMVNHDTVYHKKVEWLLCCSSLLKQIYLTVISVGPRITDRETSADLS